MSAIDDYLKKGGLEGIAVSLLSQQLREAIEDPAHLLAGVADALSQENFECAAKRLILTLSELPEGHLLAPVKTIFYTLPAVQAGYAEAVEFAARGVFPDDFPPMLAAWGAMKVTIDAYVQERNTHAARQPRRKKPGREAMIEAMTKAKREGMHLRTFLEAVKAGSIDGLSFQSPKTYAFDFHGDGDCEYEAGFTSLKKCWGNAKIGS